MASEHELIALDLWKCLESSGKSEGTRFNQRSWWVLRRPLYGLFSDFRGHQFFGLPSEILAAGQAWMCENQSIIPIWNDNIAKWTYAAEDYGNMPRDWTNQLPTDLLFRLVKHNAPFVTWPDGGVSRTIIGCESLQRLDIALSIALHVEWYLKNLSDNVSYAISDPGEQDGHDNSDL